MDGPMMAAFTGNANPQLAQDIARYLQNPAANAPKFVAPGWGARPRSRYPLSPGPPLGGGGN